MCVLFNNESEYIGQYLEMSFKCFREFKVKNLYNLVQDINKF